MSQNPIVEETKRKLNELEQRIQRGKIVARRHAGDRRRGAQGLGRHGPQPRRHRRKLEASDDQSAEVLEGISLDIDVLRHSFERWMARVEGNFAQGQGERQGRRSARRGRHEPGRCAAVSGHSLLRRNTG